MSLATLHPRLLRNVFVQASGPYGGPLRQAQREAVQRLLRDPQWVPTREACPEEWDAVEAWHQGVRRTGDRFMDSY